VPVCHFHGDRPGVGICMRCRVVICAECRTRVHGINYCHACLRALGARREERKAGAVPWALTAAFLLGLGWLVLTGLCWLTQGALAP
jgi:hypothetical protein